MNNTFLKLLLGGMLLILFQVLVFNNIPLTVGGRLNPYIYPYFLLILPLGIPRWMLLMVGFAYGLTIDMFSNTYGMHAATSVFIAWLRPTLLGWLTPRSGYEAEDEPRMGSLGFTWFFAYTILVLAIHHFIYFFLEAFTLKFFGYTLVKTLVSLGFSTFITILLEYFFTNKK